MKRVIIIVIKLLLALCIINEVQMLSDITPQVTVTSVPTPTPFRGNQTPDPITYDIVGNRTAGLDSNKYNGYYNEFNEWIPGVVKAESQFLVMPDLVIGEAWGGGGKGIHSFGDYRTIGEIVLPFCSEIGNYVWIKREGHDWEGAFRVIDCAARYDIYNVVVHRHEVAEILFDIAVDWGMIKLDKPDGEGTWLYGWNMRRIENVLVSKIRPDCLPSDVDPVVLSEWFKERVTYFETKEEGMQWEKDNPRGILTKNIDGIPQWRFDGVWITFPRNSLECE